MSEKQIAKRYLLSVSALYFGGAVLLGAYIFALRSRAPGAFGASQAAALAFLLPLVPTASYSGFVQAFLKVKELKKKQMVLFVVFFPVMLAVLLIYGAVMLVPSIIKNVRALCE